jgi:hypothetical protein
MANSTVGIVTTLPHELPVTRAFAALPKEVNLMNPEEPLWGLSGLELHRRLAKARYVYNLQLELSCSKTCQFSPH